jgi:hypothetical protein
MSREIAEDIRNALFDSVRIIEHGTANETNPNIISIPVSDRIVDMSGISFTFKRRLQPNPC